MKGFLKFIGALAAIFAAVIGALAVFDRLSNKDTEIDEYLNCTDNIPEDK